MTIVDGIMGSNSGRRLQGLHIEVEWVREGYRGTNILIEDVCITNDDSGVLLFFLMVGHTGLLINQCQTRSIGGLILWKMSR